MVRAIQNGMGFKKDNTVVDVADKKASVYLHGNLIAKVHYHKQRKAPVITKAEITDANWSTVTTKSRLNAILSLFGGGISQSNWQWYLHTSKGVSNWDGDWVTVK